MGCSDGCEQVGDRGLVAKAMTTFRLGYGKLRSFRLDRKRRYLSKPKAVVSFCMVVGRVLCSASAMNRNALLFAGTLCAVTALSAQNPDAVVKKGELSIHVVERGSMPTVASANGTLTSLRPRRAVLNFDSEKAKCEAGRGARLVVAANPRPVVGKVVGQTDAGGCEVEFVDDLPQGAVTGAKVGGLIVTDEMKDVVFFGRPAGSRPDSTATIFLLEGTSFARRVSVQYGAMSGPLIQVLHGLAPGDKVIVTDMSKFADSPRVRLE